MTWAMGNRAVISVIADMMSTAIHRFMLPVLYTTVSHGCDLQKLLSTSSYITFPMRRPFKARVHTRNEAVNGRLSEQAVLDDCPAP